MGTYGGQGYDVIDGSSSLPSYATVTPSGANDYVWAASTTDARALQTSGGSSRIAATWWTTTSFAVDVNLTDGQTHDLELYFLDWDQQGRTEQVQISDASTGAVLSTQTISSFQSGVYLDYAVSGNIVITITRQARDEQRPQRPVPRPTYTDADPDPRHRPPAPRRRPPPRS